MDTTHPWKTMYHESTRDMNDRERQVLSESLAFKSPVSARWTFKWAVIWGISLIALGLAEVGLFAFEVHPALVGLANVVMVLAGIACLFGFIACVSGYLRWRRYTKDFHRETAPRIRAALENKKVLSKQVAALSVITIEEFEDEGAGYLFDIGEGKSLILKGQQYFPAKEDMPWPSSQFEIVRSADEGVWIGLFSSGEPLVPSRVIKMEDCNDDFFWADTEEVVEGTSDEVLARILKDTEE